MQKLDHELIAYALREQKEAINPEDVRAAEKARKEEVSRFANGAMMELTVSSVTEQDVLKHMEEDEEPTSSPIDSTAAFALSSAEPSTRTKVVGGAQGPLVTFFFVDVGAETDGALLESGSCPYCKAARRNSGSLSGGIAPAALGANPANPSPRDLFLCFFEAMCCLNAASPLQSAPQTPHLK